MNRRQFLAISSSAAVLGHAAPSPTKRERMLRWLHGETSPNHRPAAFFLHFGDAYKAGPAAAQKHLEFFRHTDMDFVKIQFEQTYSRQEFLQKPSDWAKVKLAKLDFYEPLLQTVRELVKAEKKNSLILMTLYSPFMCAGHVASTPLLLRHLQEDPEAVKKGMEILTESQMLFVRACIREGIDGFYSSTQGSEAKRLPEPSLFAKYVKPYDLVAMKEVAAKCPFNILHVCDYHAPYANYDVVADYPGQVVNCNTQLTGGEMPVQEITKVFRRPFMGGLDRHAILAKGSPAEVDAEIRRVVRNAPQQMILGADCTVDANTPWDRLKHAIGVAHSL